MGKEVYVKLSRVLYQIKLLMNVKLYFTTLAPDFIKQKDSM